MLEKTFNYNMLRSAIPVADKHCPQSAGRAAERLQEEAGTKNSSKATSKATTIHRLLNYKSWSQRKGPDSASNEVPGSPSPRQLPSLWT